MSDDEQGAMPMLTHQLPEHCPICGDQLGEERLRPSFPPGLVRVTPDEDGWVRHLTSHGPRALALALMAATNRAFHYEAALLRPDPAADPMLRYVERAGQAFETAHNLQPHRPRRPDDTEGTST